MLFNDFADEGETNLSARKFHTGAELNSCKLGKKKLKTCCLRRKTSSFFFFYCGNASGVSLR